MLRTKPQGQWPFGSAKKIFEGFYHIWSWRPFWSRDLDHLNKFLFPHPIDAPYEIWLWLLVVSEEKMFEECGRRTDDRLTTEPAYTISSPMSLKAQVS